MDAPTWQPLRRYVEDSFVVKDPFELHTVQNLVLDGLLYPLVYDAIVDQIFATRDGAAIAMLTQFMTQWSAETRKWVDATMKAIVAESEENRTVVQDWVDAWLPRAKEALLPVAAIAVSEQAPALLDEVMEGFAQRLAKIGLSA
jgi:phenol hydroxylase P1 protein